MVVNVLHITNHVGTNKNMSNVFKNIGDKYNLTTRGYKYPLYINNQMANVIWTENKNQWNNFNVIVVSDVVSIARPLLQNIDDHHINIIIYITNRFDWGDFNHVDKEYCQLYSKLSTHPRVFFCSDNRYDQYYASIHGIKFFYDDCIRLVPEISVDILNENITLNNKLFVFNRGTSISIYKQILDQMSFQYDIYGENYERYKDPQHISQYLAYLHLPYQVNIQSLYENLASGVIYIIPSKQFITNLINTCQWYYWEERYRSPDLLSKSIELAEWYQDELKDLFIYFDSWPDLNHKICMLTPQKKYEKQQIIANYIKENNKNNLNKWTALLNKIQ